jgi:hypothetical protein
MRSDIFSGNYLFHLHTNFTDGLLTIPEYFEFAARNGVDRLIFLEHIRKNASYLVEDFINTVSVASHEHDVPFSIGFEAKVLYDGMLDISPDHIECADVIGIAEHGTYENPDRLEESLSRAFQFYSSHFTHKDIVWVHPGLGFLKMDSVSIHCERVQRLLDLAVLHDVRIELNLRYRSTWDCLVMQHNSAIIGLDSHDMSDLHTWLSEYSANKDKV